MVRCGQRRRAATRRRRLRRRAARWHDTTRRWAPGGAGHRRVGCPLGSPRSRLRRTRRVYRHALAGHRVRQRSSRRPRDTRSVHRCRVDAVEPREHRTPRRGRHRVTVGIVGPAPCRADRRPPPPWCVDADRHDRCGTAGTPTRHVVVDGPGGRRPERRLLPHGNVVGAPAHRDDLSRERIDVSSNR